MKVLLVIALALTGLITPAPAEGINMSAVRAVTREMWNPETLSPEDKAKMEAAQNVALADAKVVAAMASFAELRKEYQANRAKYPSERDKAVDVKFRAATKTATETFRQALLSADPSVSAILDKPQGKKNEGENETDSDTGNKAAVAPIKDEPGLPRVLLIGDSVSIGYTLQVREKLKGKANVHRIPVNGGATEVGLENIKSWLGSGKWDVIHFNFGLHDAKYASPTEQRASRDQYVANLQKLIDQMKAPGTKLIFATTTPVPEKLQFGKATGSRVFDSIPERNDLAVALMKKNDVAVDDLYALVLPNKDTACRPGDVHFTPEGYELLSGAVAKSIEQQLPGTP